MSIPAILTRPNELPSTVEEWREDPDEENYLIPEDGIPVGRWSG